MESINKDTVKKVGRAMKVLEECKDIDKPIKSNKWRALLFKKSGSTYLTKTEYSSQELCEESIKATDVLASSEPPEKFMVDVVSKEVVGTWAEYGHQVAIPMKED
jgi:hypothetical protein